jgi:hypothetical protein
MVLQNIIIIDTENKSLRNIRIKLYLLGMQLATYAINN